MNQHPSTDDRFPLFVAYATLQSYLQLETLLAKWKVPPSTDIIKDAARYGCQKAMDVLYPGLMKFPFTQDPWREVVMTLRLQYDANPETADQIQDTTRRAPAEDMSTVAHAQTSSERVRRVAGLPPSRGEIAGQRAEERLSESSMWKVRKMDDPADTSQRRKLSESSQFWRTPTPTPLPHDRNAESSSQWAAKSGAGQQPAHGESKLRPVKRAAVFPWERVKKPSDTEADMD